MASSPPSDSCLAESQVGFALQELHACWSQAYEAVTRGDLQSVEALLLQADAQAAAAGNGKHDTPAEAELRAKATSAYGLLQHGLQSGMDGIREELTTMRRGKKALRGYGTNGTHLGKRIEHEI